MGDFDAYVQFNNQLNLTHGNSESVADDLEFLNQYIQLDGPPLFKIMTLKDKGNELFTQNLFDPAGFCYDKACSLLCFAMQVLDDYDVKSVAILGISLYLNLAACANKMGEYEAAINFCSMVLFSFPKNVKALFRRAVALMKSNMLFEAQLDLKAALAVEPRNRDIHRELSVVTNLLAINTNGKRCESNTPMCDVVKPSKRMAASKKTECHVDESDVYVGVVDTSPALHSLLKDPEVIDDCVTPTVDDTNTNHEMEMDSNFENKQDCDDQKNFHFTKKNDKHSQLKIHASAYKRLLQGTLVNFYHKTQFVTVRARLLDPPEDTSVGQTKKDKGKKKRRRRRRRRRGVSNEDDLKEESNGEIMDFSEDLKTRACEVGLPITSSLMKVPPQIPSDSQQQESLSSLFSKPNIRKPFRAKRKTDRNHCHCQDGESPRHSFSTSSYGRAFSSKSLRLRGVSMSCCRYPSEAYARKKRKQRASQVSYFERIVKKPFIYVTPLPTLFSCSNNVVLTSDIENQMNNM